MRRARKKCKQVGAIECNDGDISRMKMKYVCVFAYSYTCTFGQFFFYFFRRCNASFVSSRFVSELCVFSL